MSSYLDDEPPPYTPPGHGKERTVFGLSIEQWDEHIKSKRSHEMDTTRARREAPHSERGDLSSAEYVTPYGASVVDVWEAGINGKSRRSLVGGIGKGIHVPLFDLDIPVTCTWSKTPGHFHLEIHKLVKWRAYKRILRAMVKAGLVDKEWYRLVKRRGYAVLTDRR